MYFCVKYSTCTPRLKVDDKRELTTCDFRPYSKVVYPKYSQHWPYTVAHTIVLNDGLNDGSFLSLFKLIPCPIHWIVYVLAYSNFIFKFESI